MTARRRPVDALRLGLAGLLGAGAALLVACGAGNGAGSAALIPASGANQLKSDFAAVASASSSGSCFQVIRNVVRARSDLAALPPTLDARLRSTLKSGVDTLSQRAQVECRKQPTATTPTTTTTSPTTTTGTTTTNTNANSNPTTNTNPTTDTNTNPTTDTNTTGTGTGTGTGPTTTGTTTSPPNNGGGTPAPNGQLGQVNPGDGTTGAGGTSGSGGGR